MDTVKLGLKAALIWGGIVLLVNLVCLGAGVEVHVLSGLKTVAPGEFVTHVFAVTNSEAAADTFNLSYDTPNGWSLLGAPQNIALKPGEEGTLFITITVPAGAPAKTYTITVHAVSATNPAINQSASAQVKVKPVNKVVIIPPEGKSVPPGGKAAYAVTIVNQGNAQDTLRISAQSAHQFPVTVSADQISLTPQESRTVTITVAVPTDAAPGRDLLTVSVHSTLYSGVKDEQVWFTTILPPPPEAVGGTLLDVLSAQVQFSFNHNLFTNAVSSDLYFSLAGSVYAGYFSSTLHLGPLFGPGAVTVSSFTLTYRKTPATYVVGDTFLRLTDLLSVYGRGGSVTIDADNYRIRLIGGGEDAQTRFGGLLSIGPQQANFGIGYLDKRDQATRAAAWSLSAAAEPLTDWTIRGEGALGVNDGRTSRALYFNTKIDTTPYFLSGEVFSVGTYFPGDRADQAGISVSQRLTTTDLSLRASLSHTWDNVVGDPLVPTTITDDLGLNFQSTPLKDGPTITGTCEFTWKRAPDLTAQNEIDRLLAVGLQNTTGAFPYSFSGKLSDQLDHAAATSYRTLTFNEGIGLSTDAFSLYLNLAQTKNLNLITGATLSTSDNVSLRFHAKNSIHSAQINLTNSTDTFSVSVTGNVQLLDVLTLGLTGTIGWDRNDASAATFQWGTTFTWRFDLPVPFLVTKGRISGRVFIDVNGNGRYDPGDRPVAGAIVSTRITEVSTDASGYYRFPPCAPGTYTITISHLPSDTAPPASSPQVTVKPGITAGINVPLAPIAHLDGILFDDTNKNGVYDPGEGGVAQVRILLSGAGSTADTDTAATGRFEFTNLTPGKYTVSVDDTTLPPRFTFTTPKQVTVTITPQTAPHVAIGGYIKPKQVVITFQPPTADFTYAPQHPTAGQLMMFDASNSFDFDGKIVAYAWDFNGDGKPDATGVKVTHTFTAAGTYKVTLTVTDNDGNTDSLTDTITVK